MKNTHLIGKGKCHCITDLLFDWFGFSCFDDVESDQIYMLCQTGGQMYSDFFFKKKSDIPGLFFLYFCLFNTVDSKQMFDKNLLMTGFKPQISGVEGNRSTN